MNIIPMTSFLKKAVQGRIWTITLPCPDGRQAFYRIAIHPLKEKAFRNAWKEGSTVELTEFGEMVESYYLQNN